MITIKAWEDRDEREHFLEIKGHAGQAEAGQDIVCASASILAYTLAQVIERKYSYGFFDDAPTIVLGVGDATVSCKVKEEFEHLANVEEDFAVIMTGYELLAHNYPQYVKIIDVEDD